MPKFIDLTGERFFCLKVIQRYKDHDGYHNHTYWQCKCDCGKMAIVASEHLRSGRIKSCGCWRDMMAVTHGQSKSKLYRVWRGIIERTTYKKCEAYKFYGARGIKMCKEWRQSFEAFFEWARSNGYEEGLTIDRIDSNGNYEPSNCRWIGMKAQQNNRTNNHLIECNGVTHTMSEWSDILDIKYSTLSMRLNTYGWSVERALGFV